MPLKITSSKPKKVRSKEQSGQRSPLALVNQYRFHEKDTGSPEVQVALLTQRINKLASHLKDHQKDFDSKRGLLMLVGKRRRLLNYIGRHQPEKYQTLIVELGLRK